MRQGFQPLAYTPGDGVTLRRAPPSGPGRDGQAAGASSSGAVLAGATPKMSTAW